MQANQVIRKTASLIETSEVRVAEFLIAPLAQGLKHFHSSVTEYCICLQGSLLIEQSAHEV